jgi:hypothetical protein
MLTVLRDNYFMVRNLILSSTIELLTTIQYLTSESLNPDQYILSKFSAPVSTADPLIYWAPLRRFEVTGQVTRCSYDSGLLHDGFITGRARIYPRDFAGNVQYEQLS